MLARRGHEKGRILPRRLAPDAGHRAAPPPPDGKLSRRAQDQGPELTTAQY